jgi:ABC-type phosphate transport system permease subunit
MRPLAIVGVLLIVVGLVALAVPSITFFTHERVVDAGFFHIDWQKPHTIFLNPIVGIIALVAGVVLLIAARRPAAP